MGDQSRLKAATYKKNNTNTDIHASSGIRTHDPNVRAGEEISWLRPRDRPLRWADH
jgi:hypothetical protein